MKEQEKHIDDLHGLIKTYCQYGHIAEQKFIDCISIIKQDFQIILSDRDKFAIEFKDWCDKLSFMDKVTVHPIAGSGGGNGPRELTNSELLETYLRKLFHSQKQTQG